MFYCITPPTSHFAAFRLLTTWSSFILMQKNYYQIFVQKNVYWSIESAVYEFCLILKLGDESSSAAFGQPTFVVEWNIYFFPV